MKSAVLVASVIFVGCAPRPPLEQLEDEALVTGDWAAVERREEMTKDRLEAAGPSCSAGERKRCVEEQSGIQCYCLSLADDCG
jgi:hypothetical protein